MCVRKREKERGSRGRPVTSVRCRHGAGKVEEGESEETARCRRSGFTETVYFGARDAKGQRERKTDRAEGWENLI